MEPVLGCSFPAKIGGDSFLYFDGDKAVTAKRIGAVLRALDL